jgi:hypothetical protein
VGTVDRFDDPLAFARSVILDPINIQQYRDMAPSTAVEVWAMVYGYATRRSRNKTYYGDMRVARYKLGDLLRQFDVRD